MRIGKEKQMLAEVNATKTLKRIEWKSEKQLHSLLTLWGRVKRIDYDMIRDLNHVCRKESEFCVTIFPQGKYLKIEVY